MGENPWWHPSQDDLDRDEPLPDLIELAPDYSADLPLWGCDGSGNIAWQDTKFSPQLLDRLAAWQEEFDAYFHWETGWRSTEIRDHWARQAGELASDVRSELGRQSRTHRASLAAERQRLGRVKDQLRPIRQGSNGPRHFVGR